MKRILRNIFKKNKTQVALGDWSFEENGWEANAKRYDNLIAYLNETSPNKAKA